MRSYAPEIHITLRRGDPGQERRDPDFESWFQNFRTHHSKSIGKFNFPDELHGTQNASYECFTAQNFSRQIQ